MYRSESDDDPYALPTIIRNGNISDISWVLESGDVGGIILVWIGVIFIIISVSLASYYIEEQKEAAAPPEPNKKAPHKKEIKKVKNADNDFFSVFLIFIPVLEQHTI
ncbi:MAG: hypothetical protein ACI4J0_11935 [Huintestinicola sp.]|uniref:hypothetical protein n=1 Tax=Huintestinicola sp. TaxID=2981661 RepID=UPI003F0951C4